MVVFLLRWLDILKNSLFLFSKPCIIVLLNLGNVVNKGVTNEDSY